MNSGPVDTEFADTRPEDTEGQQLHVVLEPIPHGCRGITVISKPQEHFEENAAMQKCWKEMGEVGGHFRQFSTKVRLGKRQREKGLRRRVCEDLGDDGP